MAATIGNALKVLIESELGVATYRDAAPAGEEMPYCTVIESIVVTPDGREDGGKANNVATETFQVDVWQTWRDVDGEVIESPTLATDVMRVLHGSRAEAAPMRVYGITVVSYRRLLEAERSIVHTAITATANRVL